MRERGAICVWRPLHGSAKDETRVGGFYSAPELEFGLFEVFAVWSLLQFGVSSSLQFVVPK